MDSAALSTLSDLKKRKFAPVYFLQGEETFYIDLISNFIEENVLTDPEKSFNQTIVYGKDVQVHTVLTYAKRFPMMADKQVVIVREAQDVSDLQKETGAKLLLDYILKPVPTTILVFCFKHKTLDKRKEIGKKIDQHAVSLTFKKPYENQLAEFVANYSLQRNLKIDENGVRILCEYVGNDLNRLANEVDKLSIGSNKEGIISSDQVMAMVGISREYNVFELQRALITKDVLLAAKITNYFEANTKKNPMMPMVAFLFSFFSKLLVASASPDKSERALVGLLKISPYAAKDYVKALHTYSFAKIADIVHLIKDTDLKLKGVNSGSETEGQLFRELVFRVIP
jgi:DNA polymerase-3 subunit delta